MKLNGEFDSTGVADSSDLLQARINEAEATGEIVEWDGRLRIAKKVVCPPHSKIRGNRIGLIAHHSNVARVWLDGVKGPLPYPAPAKTWESTLICDVRDENAQLVMHEGSAMQGVAIYDARQFVDQPPVETPPCILGNGQISLESVELVNCYFGVYARGSCYLARITGTPFRGIKIDGAGNGAKATDVWFERPLTKQGAFHEAVMADGIGMEVRACDGINIEDLVTLMYGTGLLFDKSEVWPGNTGANGTVRGFGPDWCKVGILVKSISWDLAFDSVHCPSPIGTPVVIDCATPHAIKFDNCSVGSFGSDGYMQLKRGNLKLTDNNFYGTSPKPHVENLGGSLTVDGRFYGGSSYRQS